MAVSLFRALGTGYLLRSTFRTSGRCFISENSNNCHSKRKRMFSSRPPSPDDATPHEKNSYGAKDGFITIYRCVLKIYFVAIFTFHCSYYNYFNRLSDCLWQENLPSSIVLNITRCVSFLQ